MRGLILIFVAACGFSASTTPLTDGGLGSGGGDAKAMPDAPSGDPDDLDGDGVVNATDNCPMKANAGQYDEDADTRGDDCDPCPHLSLAGADADDDGDGVGNGCDPRPSTAGDAIAYWNGFTETRAGIPTTMTMLHGNVARWSVGGGYLTFTHAANDTDWGMPIVDVGKPNHVVDAAFDVMGAFSPTVASAGGVVVDATMNDMDLFECQSRVDAERREMWRRAPTDATGWVPIVGVTATTPANDSYRITLQRTASDLICTNTRNTLAPVTLTSDIDSLGNTRAGLFARNVDMRFRYMIVITSP